MTLPIEILRGRVQAGENNANHWLRLFNDAYSRKLGMPVFPGSLNLALEHNFNWHDERYAAKRIWFGREEYGGERDILLLPCTLENLGRRKAFLLTPTTAARVREDPCGDRNRLRCETQRGVLVAGWRLG